MPVAYALIHEEGGVFGISFPDFPGAVSTGRSEEEVIRKGAEVLNLHVAGMIEDGDAMPMLHGLAELKKDHEFRTAAKDSVVVMIPFEMPGRSVRLNISMDEHLLDAVDRAAQEAGQSRSAFLAEAARQRVRGKAA